MKGEQDLNLFGAKGPRLCVVGKNEDGGVTSLAMKTKPAKRIQDARRNRLTGLRSLSFKNGAIKPGRLAFQVNQRSANNPVNSLRHFDKMLPLSIYSLSFCICFNSSSLLLSKFEKIYEASATRKSFPLLLSKRTNCFYFNMDFLQHLIYCAYI